MKLLEQTVLGKGGQGRVVPYGKLACKVLPRSPEAYKETYITSYLQGIPGVVKLHDVDEDDRNLYMIMDRYNEVKNITCVKQHTRDVLSVLSEIHDRNVIHNDIKPQNILQDNSGNLVIIDFGCSIFSDKPIPAISLTTPYYCSIESLSSRNCKKSDVWSVGVMVYRELTKTYPFNGDDWMTIFRQIITKDLDFDAIHCVEARDFVQRLLERDIEKRISSREALNHDWLQQGYVE